MKKKNSKDLGKSAAEHFRNMSLSSKLLGMTTIGERGQIVIPAEARKMLDLKPGDQLVVLGNTEANMVSLFTADSMGVFMAKMMELIVGTEIEDEMKAKMQKVVEMLSFGGSFSKKK